jgi:hypothetical protein
LTPGRLNPAFKPLGCLNTACFDSPPVVEAGGGVFGFFRLISASAFELKLFIIYKSKKLIFD